jgi:hypothetical protein
MAALSAQMISSRAFKGGATTGALRCMPLISCVPARRTSHGFD